MFNELCTVFSRPEPFEFYTASDLWTDEHTSKKMLEFHLNEQIDAASRNSAFIDRSVEWIVSQFHIKDGSKIADFGCGPGLYTTKLASVKAKVTGIDFSKSSLKYAQNTADKEGLSIEYVLSNYLEYETDTRFDLITMIMCDYCALSPAQRSLLLKKFASLLAPGGSVLLDVYSSKAYNDRVEATTCMPNLLDGFWSPKPYYGFLHTFKYDNETVVLDKYTIIEQNRNRTIYNWLQYFTPETLEQEFNTNGFVIDEFFSDVAGSPYNPDHSEFAVIGVKK